MPGEMSGQTPAEDDIDRQLRELTEGGADSARYREPSAAERAQAARQARKQAKKRARGVRRQDRRMDRRSGGRRLSPQALSWAVVIVVLAVAGVLSWHRFAPGTGSAATGGSASAGSAAAGPPADPFTGTPADHWAAGAAGIVIPAAKPVGPFSAAQVAAAYATTKQLLVAETLDKQTLAGGAPTAFADLLTPGARSQFLSGLNLTGADRTGEARSTRSYVESFAPGTADFIGSVIKVKASMYAQAYDQSGAVVLAIDVSDLTAYPVEQPGDPSNWMRVVADVYGFFSFSHWDSPGGPLQPWDQVAVANTGVQCPMTDGWLRPVYPSQQYGPASGRQGGNPYTPINDAPSAVPSIAPTSGSGSACTISGGST